MNDIQSIQERRGPIAGQKSVFERLGDTAFAALESAVSFAKSAGGSPLVEVPSVSAGARIFAKCEWTNPTATVKDRTALALLLGALGTARSVSARPSRILEYSGGNLASSLAVLAKAADLPLTLVLSSSTPAAAAQELRSWGADIVLSPSERGFLGVIECAVQLAHANPSWTFLHQHTAVRNVEIHRQTTGAELVEQCREMDIVPKAWITAIGTGGTLIGVWQALTLLNPYLQLFATTPAELPYASRNPPNGLPKFAGSGGLGLGWRQPLVAPFDANVSQHISVGFRDVLAAMREFHSLTGVWIGSSAAANWLAAKQVARSFSADECIVTLFPSKGTEHEVQTAIASASA